MPKKGKELKTCNYMMSVGKTCRRTLFESEHDDEHCIFHSKDIEGKKAKFENEFWKEFERQKKSENAYDFEGFVFPGDISFLKIEFEKDVNFGHATFSGEAKFWSATFSGEANFWSAKFLGKANFGYATFSWEVIFQKAKFKTDANFGKITLEKYHSLEMIDTYFYNVSGLFEFIEKNHKKFKYSNKTEFLPDNFYLILGEEATGRYPIISRKIRDDMYLLSFKKKHPKMHYVWWLFADCGRSLVRWAAWSIGFAFLFALIFWIKTPFFEFTNPAFSGEPVTDFWSYLYFSFVTFTTLGFGDIVALNWCAKLVVTLEVIAGYVMLGGLISILANKLARRS